jgi:hypothetical protein
VPEKSHTTVIFLHFEGRRAGFPMASVSLDLPLRQLGIAALENQPLSFLQYSWRARHSRLADRQYLGQKKHKRIIYRQHPGQPGQSREKTSRKASR